jgi:adenine-specific DNA-methyltransferase
MIDKRLKIQKIKGRAMLHWVGKKPIEAVESYPAQLVETVGDVKPPETPNYDALEKDWSNLLFHGDNKEILSTLLANGFRGKVDLIYIDPPFDSKADYVRKVELRGTKSKIEGEEQTAIEQVQYEDIWANDNYLQFMYERLILLRELLSDTGVIYLHVDHRKDYQLRFLLDEIFGSDNFLNSISWRRGVVRGKKVDSIYYPFNKDTITLYAKNKPQAVWNSAHTKVERLIPESDYKKHGFKKDESGYYIDSARNDYTDKSVIDLYNQGRVYITNGGELVVDRKSETVSVTKGNIRIKSYRELRNGMIVDIKHPDNIWDDVKALGNNNDTDYNYPTQKPEELLERIIKTSSDEGSIVLDAFIGSGTTAAVAQKLGRRWIGADINKGAIQTAMKRLHKISEEQSEKLKILHYRVNNYDFQRISAMRAIIVEKYGIEESKTDSYFDGTLGQRLVKIAELNKPVTKLDVQSVIDELKNRPDEDRDILLIGSGVELGVESLLANKQQLQGAVNKIEVKDIQTDGIIVAEPAEADVSIDKKDDKVAIKINSYISPTIIKRLDLDRSIFGEHIKDFRAQIDTVMIDTNYDGKAFNVAHADVPAKKSDFVAGEYELGLPKNSKKIAIKITDMLGEETMVVG